MALELDAEHHGGPPGPAEPVDLAAIRADPLTFLAELVAEYGPIARHVVDGRPVITVNDPAMVHQVLTANRANYVKSGTPDEQMLVPLLGRGLLTSDGEEWERQRQLAQPAFQHRHLVTFDTLMTTAASRVTDRWRAGAGTPFLIDRDLTALTLTVVAQALLGSDLSIGPRFGEAVDAANRVMGHDVGAGPDRRAFLDARTFLDHIVGLLIGSARFDDSGRDDLLAHLLRARSDERPEGFSPAELRDQVLTMLMAGHETTAKGLSWTFYLLDQHPAERTRLEAEVDVVLSGRLPTAADVSSLPVCRNVVLEALRLYPPVWLISRHAVAEDTIAGYRVPAGALVCISPWLLHRRPEAWGEDAEAFVPGRFVGRPELTGPGSSFLPFSAGPRQCIGQQFALLESTLVLATLVAGVRLHLVPGHPVVPEALVTLRPRDGLLMTAEPRGRADLVTS